MESSKKNSPGPLVIGGIAVIVFIIAFYLIITMFFPDLLRSMSVGEAKPVE